MNDQIYFLNGILYNIRRLISCLQVMHEAINRYMYNLIPDY